MMKLEKIYVVWVVLILIVLASITYVPSEWWDWIDGPTEQDAVMKLTKEGWDSTKFYVGGVKIDTEYVSMFTTPIYVPPEPIITYWTAGTNYDWVFYITDSLKAEIGFRSNGTVIWREIE